MPKSGKSHEIPLETFSKVVEAIYDCALDTNRWHDTIRMIAELLESQWCALGVHDYALGGDELAFRLGYDEEFWPASRRKVQGYEPLLRPSSIATRGNGCYERHACQ